MDAREPVRGHPLEATWRNMMARCYNPRNPAFARYGGRGIKVCKRWHVFANFVADVSPKPIGLSLDRRDNNKGYTPANCRWATAQMQNRNRTDNRPLTIDGVTKLLCEWSVLRNIPAATIAARLRKGWPENIRLISKNQNRRDTRDRADAN